MKLNDKYPHMKRVGFFFLPTATILQQPALAQAVMACVIVLDADRFEGRSKADGAAIRYLAVSGLFDPHAGAASEAPYYQLEFHPADLAAVGLILDVAGQRMKVVARKAAGVATGANGPN